MVDSRNDRRAAHARHAMRKRALRATLIALLLVGGGYAWQKNSSEHTAAHAEQARQNALKMTAKKWEALEREAVIEAAAKAFAAKHAAEKQAEAQRRAAEQARLQATQAAPQKKS